MATVLFTTGLSAGDTLGSISRAMMKRFEEAGHRAFELDLLQPGSSIDLRELLSTTKVDFAVGLCGFGWDTFVVEDDGIQNIWEFFKVPFLSVHGDSPAYCFERHIAHTPWHATVYGFGDHYDFRMRLPKKEGIFCIGSPFVFDTEPYEKIDFKAKRQGQIIFPKNGGNPLQLSEEWRKWLPKHVTGHLAELSQILIHNIENEGSCDIDALVLDMFTSKGVDVSQAAKLRLFYVAQLDDFMRRVKAVLVADVLKEFPVAIYGKNWDFLDMSNAKCHLIDECNYHDTRKHINASLAVLDFTPNTCQAVHDRFLRASGLYTACLTNKQRCITEIYGEGYGLTYDFNADSLRNKITVMLANPDDVIEAGIEASKRFLEVLPIEAALNSLIDTAEAVRLSATSGFEGMREGQSYFYWPPAALNN